MISRSNTRNQVEQRWDGQLPQPGSSASRDSKLPLSSAPSSPGEERLRFPAQNGSSRHFFDTTRPEPVDKAVTAALHALFLLRIADHLDDSVKLQRLNECLDLCLEILGPGGSRVEKAMQLQNKDEVVLKRIQLKKVIQEIALISDRENRVKDIRLMSSVLRSVQRVLLGLDDANRPLIDKPLGEKPHGVSDKVAESCVDGYSSFGDKVMSALGTLLPEKLLASLQSFWRSSK